MVKCCLYKLVRQEKLPYVEFLTIFSDIQNAINSQPLTDRCLRYCSLDVITPNAFLCPHYYSSIFFFLNTSKTFFGDELSSGSDLLKSLEHRYLFLDRFHSLWHEEYLLSPRDLYQ